ncbi:conserved hypothetical protein [Xenorhabdus nematophila str. Anatoliense]|nr:conserved hypothetical protein [Xenorhabdus nematophila str. Anatoliense]
MFISSSKIDDKKINKKESKNIETGSHLEIDPENKQDTESNGVTIGTIKAGTHLYKTTAIEDYLNTATTLGIEEYKKQYHLNLKSDEELQWTGQYLALEKSSDEYTGDAPARYEMLRKKAGKEAWEAGKVLKVFSYTFEVTKDIKILKPDNHSDAYYVDGSTTGCKKADAIRRSVQTQSKKNTDLFSELTNLKEHNFLLEELGEKGYAWMGPLHPEEGTEFSYELAISPNLLRQHLTLESEELLDTYTKTYIDNNKKYPYWKKKEDF